VRQAVASALLAMPLRSVAASKPPKERKFGSRARF
jgi:hypothetical protein